MTDIRSAPVVRSVDVIAPVEKAFEVFTSRIAEWWPLGLHSIYGDKAATAIFEPRVGGRVFERSADGEEARWADVVVFEPPHRVVLAWKPNTNPKPPTTVEVTFTSDGPTTRVVVTHTGWELLGDDAEDARSSYGEGWIQTLEHYAGALTPR